MFLGKMTKWNDRALQGLNPVTKLPGRAMVVCHRSDARGTTYVFADYLSKVSPEWANTATRASPIL
jgi:phosphate transport system substrate-binding protein